MTTLITVASIITILVVIYKMTLVLRDGLPELEEEKKPIFQLYEEFDKNDLDYKGISINEMVQDMFKRYSNEDKYEIIESSIRSGFINILQSRTSMIDGVSTYDSRTIYIKFNIAEK